MAFEPLEYSSVHRLFLQSCANHGAMEVPKAIELLTPMVEKFIIASREDDAIPFESPGPDKKALKELVSAINAKIGRFDQKIDFVRYDLDNAEYLVFAYKSEISMNK
jgi:hypothetical protein